MEKVSSKTAGYMELEGAKKDAGCERVNVDGGVSSKLGCCNLFGPKKGVQEFRCGSCEYILKQHHPLRAAFVK